MWLVLHWWSHMRQTQSKRNNKACDKDSFTISVFPSSSSAFKLPHSWGCIRVWTTPDSSCAADGIAVLTEGGWGDVKPVTVKMRFMAKNHSPAQRSLECEKVLSAYLWSSTVEQKGSVMVCKHVLLSQIPLEVSDKNVQKPVILFKILDISV